jgi:hypothetical protein
MTFSSIMPRPPLAVRAQSSRELHDQTAQREVADVRENDAVLRTRRWTRRESSPRGRFCTAIAGSSRDRETVEIQIDVARANGDRRRGEVADVPRQNVTPRHGDRRGRADRVRPSAAIRTPVDRAKTVTTRNTALYFMTIPFDPAG